MKFQGLICFIFFYHLWIRWGVSRRAHSQECTLSQFADDTNWEEWLTHPEGCVAIQRHLGRLEKWADGNIMKINKGNYKVLHLGRSSSSTKICWGMPSIYVEDVQLKRCFAEQDLGQTQASSVSLPIVSWGASEKVVPAGPGKWLSPLLSTGKASPGVLCPGLGILSTRGPNIYWGGSNEGPQIWQRDWTISL